MSDKHLSLTDYIAFIPEQMLIDPVLILFPLLRNQIIHHFVIQPVWYQTVEPVGNFGHFARDDHKLFARQPMGDLRYRFG